jgi:hypothetical protein
MPHEKRLALSAGNFCTSAASYSFPLAPHKENNLPGSERIASEMTRDIFPPWRLFAHVRARLPIYAR